MWLERSSSVLIKASGRSHQLLDIFYRRCNSGQFQNFYLVFLFQKKERIREHGVRMYMCKCVKWPKKNWKLVRHYGKMANSSPSSLIYSFANPTAHQLLILNTQRKNICNLIKAQAGRFYLEILW